MPLLGACLLASPLGAQVREGPPPVFAGDDTEEYLRYRQTLGSVALYPWSIRSFSAREVDRLLDVGEVRHPWERSLSLAPDTARGFRLHLLPVESRAIYNSAFPFGYNDGAVWAGRGGTGVLRAGFRARFGPATLVVAPEVFHAQNRDFELAPNGRGGPTAFGDELQPIYIDLPQRFGAEPYSRVDPGQSTLRVDIGPVAAGISTAGQTWGPASTHPLILGTNAPGYVHRFLGTSTPVPIWIGALHGRLVWGELEQSAYSDVSGLESRRFMSGLVATFTPRGVAGLELGASRFFHTPWPLEGLRWRHYAKPLEGLLKAYLPERNDGIEIPDQQKSDEDNQLASVFARWVFPGSGLEVYGEFAREDHNFNLRDVAVQLDQHSAYLLGIRKAWSAGPESMAGLRAEVVNAQPSHLLQVREQYSFYIHGAARQGHTNRGQLLGSAAARGGAGSIVAGDWYSPRGRWTLEWSRWLRQERRPHLVLVGSAYGEAEEEDPEAVDVMHTLGLETVRFWNGLQATVGLTAAYNLNRNFGNDVLNWNIVFGLQAQP